MSTKLIRAIASQLQNVFCATGEGGGVDPTCSTSEAEALETYISTDYESVNGVLRSGKLPPHLDSQTLKYKQRQLQRVKDTVAGLDSLLAKEPPLKETRKVYRGVGGNLAAKLLRASPGDVFVEKAYLSTTPSLKDAAGWAEYQAGSGAQAILHISVEKGIKGISPSDVAKVADVTDKKEREFLLERGITLRVTKVDGPNVHAVASKERKR